jgi:hypothetical protein
MLRLKWHECGPVADYQLRLQASFEILLFSRMSAEVTAGGGSL